MLNLRYHIVSLVAVFLALGIGIAVGSAFISRVTVDQLRKRLDSVDASVSQTRKTNDQLTSQIRTWERFADQGRPELLAGELKGVPVVVVGVQGINRKPVDDFIGELSVAGAVNEGTLWLTPKLNLSTQGDVSALATALGVAVDSPDVLRATALSRLATLLGGTGDPSGLLPALQQAGFVEYEQPPSPSSSTTVAPPVAPGGIPLVGTRTVVISGAGARLEDDTMTMPFLVQLGLQGAPVVAAEAGQDTPGGRGVFVGLVMRNAQTSPRISTVDNLESFMGQAASVLALAQLAHGAVGHYGVGPGAQRLLPDLSAGT